MNSKEKELTLLDIQNLATFLYIISLIISLSLTNYDKEEITKERHKRSPKTQKKLSIFNRVFVIVLTLTFLYINYASKKIAKEKGNKTQSFNLQIAASWLSLSATLIALYVVVYYQDYTTISGIENPNI